MNLLKMSKAKKTLQTLAGGEIRPFRHCFDLVRVHLEEKAQVQNHFLVKFTLLKLDIQLIL